MKRKYENFTLEEFKFIYFMEWSHRYAGRITGWTRHPPARARAPRRPDHARGAAGLGFALPLVRSSLATSRPRNRPPPY
jgi:heme A synthase